MPTYEYLCQTCSHRFETWQKMIDEPLTICPQCGNHIRRVFYPAGIVFKGPGFYKTDRNIDAALNRNGNTEKHDGAGADGANGAGTSETKTDGAGTAVGSNSDSTSATSASSSSSTSSGESTTTASSASK